jgi:YVTN family beta-propeller protein
VVILDLVNWEKVGDIDVPGEPHGLVYSPDGRKAYVVQRKLNQVAIIDTVSRKITKTAPAGKRPDMIAISPDGKNLYVTSRDENKLLVLSAADLSRKAEVETGDEPHGVAYRK